MQLNGLVPNPVTVSYGDGTNPMLSQGRQGEALVSELHGKFYSANYRGKLFIASTAAAGVTILANAANLVSVFSLWNPAGSGINMELVDCDIIMINATEVVAALGLVAQFGVGSAIAVPGTLTKATPNPGHTGYASTPGGNVGQFYTALTHVGTPSIFKWLTGIQATANGEFSSHTDFDGKVIVAPGTVVSIAGTAAQTQPAVVSLSWVEYPTP